MLNRKREASAEAMERWRTVMDNATKEDGQPTTTSGQLNPSQQVATSGNIMPREAQVQRYMQEHRGNAQAVIQFAAAHVGEAKAFEEAKRYVQQMERLLQGGQ